MRERRPGDVPEDGWPAGGWPVDVLAHGTDGRPIPADGFDADGDGRPDTAVAADGVDLVLLTDLDGDGLADQVLRIGPDAVVRLQGPERAPGPGGGVLDGLLNGSAAGNDD